MGGLSTGCCSAAEPSACILCVVLADAQAPRWLACHDSWLMHCPVQQSEVQCMPHALANQGRSAAALPGHSCAD